MASADEYSRSYIKSIVVEQNGSSIELKELDCFKADYFGKVSNLKVNSFLIKNGKIHILVDLWSDKKQQWLMRHGLMETETNYSNHIEIIKCSSFEKNSLLGGSKKSKKVKSRKIKK